MFSKITSWRHSKFIAFALAVAVFLSAFYGLAPVLTTVEALGEDDAASTVGYWDGSKDYVYTEMEGDGSAGNPYQITNGAQLYAATGCTEEGVHFKLMNDIVLQKDAEHAAKVAALLTGGEDKDGLYNWNSTYREPAFKGHFDGNFKTVSGVYLAGIGSSAGGSAGLFYSLQPYSTDRAEATSVINLTIKDSYYKMNGGVGALASSVTLGSAAGYVNVSGCRVENCHVENYTYGDGAGGFFGSINRVGLTVNDCLFDGTLVAPEGKHTGSLTPSFWTMFGRYSNDSTGWSNLVPGTNPNYGLELYNFISYGGYTLTSMETLYLNNAQGWARGDVWNSTGADTVYTDGFANAPNTKNTTQSWIKYLDAANMKGSAAYATMTAINPSNGWVVLEEGATPVYVGVDNVSNYDYLPHVWNGDKTATVEGMKGEGTKESPKLIFTGAELYAATGCTTNTYFKLMNDIQLQTDANMDAVYGLLDGTITSATGLNNWNSTYREPAFKGHFDGNFKTVSGLYLAGTGSSAGGSAGLFYSLQPYSTDREQATSVINLTIKDSYYKMNGTVGALAGSATLGSAAGYVTVSGCRVENCHVENYTYGDGAGGFFGSINRVGLTVSDCLFDGSLTAPDGKHTGSLTPSFWTMFGRYSNDSTGWDNLVDGTNPNYGLELDNFISYGGYTLTSMSTLYLNNAQGWGRGDVWNSTGADTVYTDGFANAPNTTNTTQSWIKYLDAANMKGSAAYATMPGITPAQGWVVLEEGATPVYVGSENVSNYDYLTPVWDGTKPSRWAQFQLDDNVAALEGEGTVESPKLISTGYELYAALNNNTESKVFKIINDINLNGHSWKSSSEFDASAVFVGVIDGGNNTIYGLKTHNALIPKATSVTINNLHLRDVTISGGSDAAAFVLYASEAATFNGCSLKDFNISGASIVAGFVLDVVDYSGAYGAVINNCVVEVDENSLVGTTYGARGFAKNATFTNSIIKGYAPTWSNSTPGVVYALGFEGMASGTFDTAKAFKTALTDGQKTALSEYFYWDNVSNNVPMLKGASCADAKDVDGDETLTASDAVSLKEILLSDTSLTQVKADNFNTVDGIDVTDVAALYYATK